MGSLFRKKPAPPVRPPKPLRHQVHYAFAYVILAQKALAEGTAFLQEVQRGGAPLLQDWWSDIVRQLAAKSQEPPGDLASQGSGLKVVVREGPGPRKVLLVQMPPPQDMPEAFFVACIYNSSQAAPRVFTLEKGLSFDASIHTVLGEWQPGGRHLNLGSGPPPELEAFLAVLPK